MRFYQIEVTKTTLGGSPQTASQFFQVFDNAYNQREELLNQYEKNGYHIVGSGESTEEVRDADGNWTKVLVTVLRNDNWTEVEIKVYTRDFSD
jgi:hypothetical protein